MMIDQLYGKKIAIIGLSIEGIATVKYLSHKGINLTVCDQQKEINSDSEVNKLINDKHIATRFGKDYLNYLEDFDYIIRTPGLPLWNKYLLKAAGKKIIITSHTKLFFDLCKGKIIGVTGTKGKGTTSTLIYNLLKAAGKDVYLGGNIGTPPLTFIDKVKPDSWVILELSSFQLEDLTKSPHIAVILNITSDHLYSSSFENPNYHLSKKDYLKAKLNILLFQKKADYAVLSRDHSSSYLLKKYTKGQTWFFSNYQELKYGCFVKDKKIIFVQGKNRCQIAHIDKVKLRGAHNLENITASITTAYLAGVEVNGMEKAVTQFKGLEHRLELIKVVQGIKYYNDSFSTTPETTIAAIKSFQEPIILICGGSEKGLSYTRLGSEIMESSVKKVILIGVTAVKIKKAIENASKKLNKKSPQLLTGATNISEVMRLVAQSVRPGDVVLLSPASASFDMFRNYKERGLLFKQAVASL